MREVVITGLGIYSCIGRNKHVVEKSLREGFCGIINDESRLNTGFRSPLTGFILPPSIPYNVTRFMALGTEYLYEAAKEALHGSNISKCGVVIGNDGNSVAISDALNERSMYKKNVKLGPTHVIKTMTSNASSLISNKFGLKGVSFTVGGGLCLWRPCYRS